MGVSGHLRLRLPAALSKILGQRGVHDFHEFPYKLVSWVFWECWTHLSSQNHDISKGWVATRDYKDKAFSTARLIIKKNEFMKKMMEFVVVLVQKSKHILRSC